MVVWHYGFRMFQKVDPATALLCTVEKQNRVRPQTMACKLDRHPSSVSDMPLCGLLSPCGEGRTKISRVRML